MIKRTVYLYVPGSEDWSWDSESSGPSYEPFVTLSAKPTQRPYSARVWQSRPWIKLLWPTIFNPLMADRGVASFIASLRESRVSHSVSQADAKAKPTSDGLERTSSESLMRYDLSSSSWRMSPDLLQEVLTPSSEDWKKLKQGGARSGVCFVRTEQSQPRTAVSGSSWSRNECPTPSATPYGTSQNEGQVPHKRATKGTPSLETWAKQWPTPRTISGGAESAERKQELGRTASGGGDLQAAAKNWPTPAARDYKGTNTNPEAQKDQLPNFVRHRFSEAAKGWPTPTAGDHGRQGRKTSTDGETTSPQAGPRRLSPVFVEALMGFPKNWSTPKTGCGHWATQSFLSQARMRLQNLLKG